MLLRQRLDQLLFHAVGRAQLKLALRLVEHVDRSGFRAGKLHRLGNDGLEHGLQVKRGIDRLADLAQRAQLLNQLAKLVGSLAQRGEEPRVLNGDHGLAGKARDQRDLLVGKGPNRLPEDA